MEKTEIVEREGLFYECVYMISHVWFFANPNTKFLCPWDFPGKNTEWVAISSSRELPDPRVECVSAASPALAEELFATEPPGKSLFYESPNR